jgi:hypothetical protein
VRSAVWLIVVLRVTVLDLYKSTLTFKTMKTDALDACVRIISYHVHMDQTVIDELVSPEMDIFQKFDEPSKAFINLSF